MKMIAQVAKRDRFPLGYLKNVPAVLQNSGPNNLIKA
jgi:hypothetical protein